jgi:hypothetical protein
MLTVYRRHNPALCKSTDRYYKRCTCPTWVEGMVGDKYVRHGLKPVAGNGRSPKCARWMRRKIQLLRRRKRTSRLLSKGPSTNIWRTRMNYLLSKTLFYGFPLGSTVTLITQRGDADHPPCRFAVAGLHRGSDDEQDSSDRRSQNSTETAYTRGCVVSNRCFQNRPFQVLRAFPASIFATQTIYKIR